MTSSQVLNAILAETESGRPAALCAIVATRGSAPQPAGTIVCVDADAHMTGSLGGGCMEAEVRREAHRLIMQKQCDLLTFKLDDDFGHDDGMICGGNLDVAIQTVYSPAEIAAMRSAVLAIEKGRAATLVIRVQGADRLPQVDRPRHVAPAEGTASVAGALPVAEYRIALESTPRLVIAGAGHISRALATIAVMGGFDVSVIDERADLNHAGRFPSPIRPVVGDIAQTLAEWPIDARTYVVIVTRGHKHDEVALAAVLDSPAPYIGMIGSKRKIAVIFDDLRHQGASDERLARVHAPIGLDIGAVTANEIAVAIAAQLISERRKDYRSVVVGPLPVSDDAT